MLFAVLSGYLFAVVSPWLQKLAPGKYGWFAALLPGGLFAFFASKAPAISRGDIIVSSYDWLPALGLSVSLWLDGLSLLFTLLICGIGALVFIYAGSYLHDDEDLPRFYVFLLAFFASMLGLVLSDNLLTLFIFWELTSITSYLLIGYHHEDENSRKSALQALLVTAGGGLALMVGVILLGQFGGTYSIAELIPRADALKDHAFYVPILLCVLAGAFTKSAQFPFHFWLPNAMAAPTPVSAYLHSATMVKAGIYLLARLTPLLGGTELWVTSLSLVGGVTMFTGAWLTLRNTDLKRILAYSTVMALGMLTMLLGIGTEKAIIAFAAFLFAHSMYKGALFMFAGIIDHGTGTKNVLELGGLRKKMPITAVGSGLAGISLAGLPPLFGFVAKELTLEAVLGARAWSGFLLILTVGSAIIGTALAALVALRPFWGKPQPTPNEPHEAPFAMLVGPSILAALALVFGVMPFLIGPAILNGAVRAVHGDQIDFYLSLWHGLNLPLLLSVLSLLAGIGIYLVWDRTRHLFAGLDRLQAKLGPENGYKLGLAALLRFAHWQTRILQNGSVRNYMIVIILTTVGLVGYSLFTRHSMTWGMAIGDFRFFDLAIASFIIVAAFIASTTRSRLGSVAAMGFLGFGVALIYILFSAPDLGITQVLIETFTVILLVLVLFKLPPFSRLSSPRERLRDAFVGFLGGGLMTVLAMAAVQIQYHEPISSYFVENSMPLGHGRNIVNVILVDFRSLDTLGELFVLSLAAIGVYSMLNLKGGEEK